jgi:hypothetical protein
MKSFIKVQKQTKKNFMKALRSFIKRSNRRTVKHKTIIHVKP